MIVKKKCLFLSSLHSRSIRQIFDNVKGEYCVFFVFYCEKKNAMASFECSKYCINFIHASLAPVFQLRMGLPSMAMRQDIPKHVGLLVGLEVALGDDRPFFEKRNEKMVLIKWNTRKEMMQNGNLLVVGIHFHRQYKSR